MATARKPVVRTVDPNITRISISLSKELRKNLRIAAAFEEVTVGEFCANVLEDVANKAIKTKGR